MEWEGNDSHLGQKKNTDKYYGWVWVSIWVEAILLWDNSWSGLRGTKVVCLSEWLGRFQVVCTILAMATCRVMVVFTQCWCMGSRV